MYPVVTLSVSLLAFFYIFLTVKVINLRKHRKVSIGANGFNDLKMAMRAHGNFSEYVPITMILALCAESYHANPVILASIMVLFIIGRALHAYAFLYSKQHFKFRIAGMILTFITLILLSILNLWHFFVSFSFHV